jgi:hypothetical protein
MDCDPVATPLDHHHPFGVDTDVYSHVPNLLHAFQHLVGSLLFIQQYSCSDLSVVLLKLSQYCSNPEPHHFAAAKRVLRYLKGTKSLRLHYGGAKRNEVLSGMTDADWALDRADRASISGYIWIYAGGPISWSSKKQNCIVLSSTKAEYIALTRAVQEGIWLCASLTQLHIPVPLPLVIVTDNNGALSLSENDSSHSRAKHIDICYHFIRSHIKRSDFLIKHVPGIINSAYSCFSLNTEFVAKCLSQISTRVSLFQGQFRFKVLTFDHEVIDDMVEQSIWSGGCTSGCESGRLLINVVLHSLNHQLAEMRPTPSGW